MGKFFNISLSLFAATGSFLFGYDAGVMTDVILSPNFIKYMNPEGNPSTIGAINSTFSGGAVFGALMGGLTMDRFGRRKSIMLGAILCAIGGVLQAAAVNLAMILLGRIIAGWAIGLMSMAVPVYQSECAHPKMRGFIVGLSQQMIGVGFIVSTWIGFGCSKAPDTNSIQWRFPLAFQALPAVILAVGILFFPESPRQLMETDQEDEAMKVLMKLHFDGTNEDWVVREFNEIRVTIAAEKALTAPGWMIMFTVPKYRTRLMHGVAVQVFTQMTGINVIGYYQGEMYKALGFTSGTAVLVAGIYNCVGPAANLIFIYFLLDRVGRRKPLLWGTIGITIALLCEGIVNSQNTDPVNEPHYALSVLGVFFIFCVSIIFSWSFGPISWVYMAEVMPMQIRARGNAFATGIGNWLVSTFWNQLSPLALKELTWKFYFLFVAWNIVVTFPVIFFFFKETNQVSLEDIDVLFGERELGAPQHILDKDGHGSLDAAHVETKDQVEDSKLADPEKQALPSKQATVETRYD